MANMGMSNNMMYPMGMMFGPPNEAWMNPQAFQQQQQPGMFPPNPTEQ